MSSAKEDNSSTNFVATKRVRVESANLTPASNASKQLSSPTTVDNQSTGLAVELLRQRCTFYRLLTDNSPSGGQELTDMVAIARDCLTSQGILPVKTSDTNDAEEADKVLGNLLSSRFRLVFKRCYILGVLAICPTFFNVLTTKYNVDAEKLDAFVNNKESLFSIHYTNYCTAKIKDANLFVALIAALWLQMGGPDVNKNDE